MRKERIEKEQPLAFRTIQNDSENRRFASAYLCAGPAGSLKKDAAILLAQSIFCEKKDGPACEVCNTCRRVEEGIYTDMIHYDGHLEPISKEQVDHIQATFAKTNLETGGARVYILEMIESASVGAQNSLLKFLEEPGEGVTAILTTDNIHAVIPTIISRCRVITLRGQDRTQRKSFYIEQGYEEEEAFFLSLISENTEEAIRMKEEGIYDKALMMLKESLDLNGSHHELLADWEYSYRYKDAKKGSEEEGTPGAFTAKEGNLLLMKGWLSLLDEFGHDVILARAEGPSWYNDKVKKETVHRERYADLLLWVKGQRDKINRFNDVHLLLAQTARKLEEWYDTGK